MYLRGDAFNLEQKRSNFEYYEKLTVRDSSLSACCQAVIAAEVGFMSLAYDYLGEAALMDLENLEHDTRDGLHVASLAGTWIALVAGFRGMREGNDTLTFAPHVSRRGLLDSPSTWSFAADALDGALRLKARRRSEALSLC
jgi:alpha,alpha-trehalose phosphorylase